MLPLLALLALLLGPATLAAAPLSLPPAPSYGQAVPRRLLCDPVAWPRPVDGALCDAAHLLAREAARLPEKSETDERELAQRDLLARWAPFLALRQGVPDPRVHAFVIQSPRYGVIYDQLEQAAARVSSGHRIGIGVAPIPGGAIGVLLSIESLVRPSPFPRRPRLGSTPEIRGMLSRGVRVREALLEDPSGSTRPIELPKSARTDRFRVKLPPLSSPGQYRFQLIVERGQGPEIGLLAPLLVEVPEPQGPPAAELAPERSTALPLADRAHLLLTRLRASKRLSALGREPILDRVALERARTMARERRVVHEPRDGTNAGALLKQEGFVYRFLAEDVALGPTLPLAFESLLRSPAHRGALLETRADRVGTGAVATEDGVYLAILLARVRPLALATPLSREIDRQRAMLGLFEKIQRNRKAADLRRSRRDPDLDRIAQLLVERLAATGKTQDAGASAKVKALLADRDPPPSGAFVDVVVAPEVDDAATAPAALDPGCRDLGLGAAVGQREGLEQAWIVVLCLPDD